MFPLIPPPVPPALIEPVVIAQVSSSHPHYDLAQTLPSDSPSQTVPPVVEFYFSDPQKVPSSSTETPVAPDSANVLGDPITVTPEQTQPTTQITQPVQKSAKAADEVILGLNRQGLPAEKLKTQKLIIENRNGQKRGFQFSLVGDKPNVTPTLPEQLPENNPNGNKEPDIIELIADQQEYDSINQVITARGNVLLRLSNGLITSDRLQINLPKRLAVAEGNVVLTRGKQVIQGSRFEYYFVEDSGIVFNANGEIDQQTTANDFSPSLSNDVSAGTNTFFTLNDRLAYNQPLQRISTGKGFQYSFGTQRVGSPGGSNQTQGTVNRIRFQAEELKFEGSNWDATDVRLTNDPFSPPELEIRANQASFRKVDPLVDVATFTNSRLVFDQRFSVPIQNQLIFDRRKRNPFLFSFGYDGEDRGGLFIERGFQIIDTKQITFELTPQYLLQKALFPDAFPTANPTNQRVGVFSPAVFGLVGDFKYKFDQRNYFRAVASFSSLEFTQSADYLRSKIQFQHKIGWIDDPYLLNVEYNYRERLFNGSLGYQTVQNSIGAVIVSPSILLGDTGIRLSYQGSIQNINAATDQIDLLPPNPKNNLTTLMRFQTAATLSRGFLLWYGEALPPNPEQGLKYTPNPVLPYLQFFTGLTGVASFYSSGDTQPSLTGTVGLYGQLGHFSRSFFDYTGFNISYSQGLRGDASPFYFDRFVDQKIISFGITQQLYGPIRFGFQSSYSLDTNKEISTDYTIEWSRRTYSILLRYNPILELGAISLRISDFNWSGNPGLFEGTLIRPVVDGVTR